MNSQTVARFTNRLKLYRTLAEAIAAKEKVRKLPNAASVIIMAEDHTMPDGRLTISGRNSKAVLWILCEYR
jgi:hypothetical protein